jgi:hypothetical protein
MNCLLLIVLCLTLFVSTPTFVKADTMLRVILNNGTIGTGMSCNDADSVLIDSVFNFTFRRNLRNIPDKIDERKIKYFHHIEGDVNRRSLWPGKCANLCSGVTTGRCWITDCVGYRRTLTYATGPMSNSTLCQMTSARVDTDLTYLVTQDKVSSTCKALLNARRTFECYEHTMYGVIEYFNLYDANTDRPIKNAIGGNYPSCSRKLVNFLVLANDCVSTVNISLTGTNGYVHEKYDDTIPFTLFGMNGTTSTTNFNGRILPIGNYTISAIPDGDITKKRRTTFSVVPC